MISKGFVVKGSVIIERYNINPKIKLLTDDIDIGLIAIDVNEINPDFYYSVDNDKGVFDIMEITLVDTNEEFSKWI